MKNIAKILLSAGLMCLCAGAYAEDKYDQLSKELIAAGEPVHGKKIAIIPFSYADGRAAAKDGSVIAERLTIKMINSHKFEIIERSVLDKVMAELKLQASGVIDASSAQQLGKVLGVEAIITGTLVETQDGQIEVNARLIKTETAQAIGASQVTLKKDWIGDASAAPQQQVYQQPVYEKQAPAQAQAPYRRARGQYEYGYFDVFMGFGTPNMALEFSNPKANIQPAHIAMSGTGSYSSIKADKLLTEGFGPLALRIGGYGNNNVGGAFEMGLERRNVKPQTAAWQFNSGAAVNKTLTASDWLTVTSFYMGGDLMVRFTKKTIVEPYMGVGLGLSLNSISMPNAYGYTNGTWNKPMDDFAVGLVVNVPFGMRIRLGEGTQLLTEMRYQMNTVKFDRDINSESDTLTLSGMYFNLGLGFNF